MTDIRKVTNIDSNLKESAYRQAEKEKKQEKTKTDEVKPKSFSDIYDGRLLGELNKSSAKFQLKDVEEAGEKLKEIVSDMDSVQTDNVVIDYPAEAVIELSLIANNRNQR